MWVFVEVHFKSKNDLIASQHTFDCCDKREKGKKKRRERETKKWIVKNNKKYCPSVCAYVCVCGYFFLELLYFPLLLAHSPLQKKILQNIPFHKLVLNDFSLPFLFFTWLDHVATLSNNADNTDCNHESFLQILNILERLRATLLALSLLAALDIGEAFQVKESAEVTLQNTTTSFLSINVI